MVSPESGSKEWLSIDAVAVQFAPADTVTFWHTATGGWLVGVGVGLGVGEAVAVAVAVAVGVGVGLAHPVTVSVTWVPGPGPTPEIDAFALMSAV